jgi:hypothetical protein
MKRVWQRFVDFWTVPRFMALLLVVLAFFAFRYLATKPYTGPTNLSEDKASALGGSGYAFNVVMDNANRSPIHVAQTLANMREYFIDQGWHAQVVIHGASFMVTFPQQPAVCVAMPFSGDTFENDGRIVPC